MKKPLIVLFLLALCSNLFADIGVKSFRKLENDMSARIDAPKRDQNGDVCAIIKVVTTQTGFIWEPDGLGIISAESKGGEYWLYVPYGAKRLTIKHPQLGILRDYFYTLPIEKATVYELVLISGKVVTIVEETIESQWLLINTQPSGADVYINDQPAGKTPFQNELPTGKYTYRIQKELYLNEAGAIDLVAGDLKQKIELKLKPNFGILQLATTPENGATVTLNGMPTGKITPCTFETIPTGEHTVTVSNDMYETTSQRFSIVAGETNPLVIDMKPTFAGISVTTDPLADIYINGQKKGNGTWHGRLNPGVFTFEAKLDKHLTAVEKQAVILGQPLSINLKPTPQTGNLKVMSTPFEATIKLNGKEVGQTPTTLKNILIGEYTVEISLPAYATSIEKVTITEGQTATINSTLTNGKKVTIHSEEPGATLFIDGNPVGQTPLDGNLTFGRHTFRIEHDGKNAERTVNISQTGGETSYMLNFGPKIFTETVNGVSFDMVAVKGGTFDMGTNFGEPDEKPVHATTINSFSFGKTEVNQALWIAVMGSNPSQFKGDSLPVEQVSWNDIQLFLEKINQLTGRKYRLPTESEWEYAASASPANSTTGVSTPSKQKWAGTNSQNDLDNFAWTSSNSKNQSHPVGTKQPNANGLYDMSGNVWEWCNDRYSEYSAAELSNPTGPVSGASRIFRGGCWYFNAQYCRVANRDYSYPAYRSSYVGFRLVMDSE